MGKLNIAHHKSYHPYRRDNIERVRRDEEEARLKEEKEEGRMMLADAEARIQLLRERAGVGEKEKEKKRRRNDDEELDRQLATGTSTTLTNGVAQLPTTNGHINFFGDLEQGSIATMVKAATKKAAAGPAETEKGVPLMPSEKDLKPWYSGQTVEDERQDDKRKRDENRKSAHDPLTTINHQLAPKQPSTRPPRPPAGTMRASTSATSSMGPPELQARLTREQSERQRAQELIARKRREMTMAAGNATPSTVYSEGAGYSDQFNKAAVQEAHGYGPASVERWRMGQRRWDDDDDPRERHRTHRSSSSGRRRSRSRSPSRSRRRDEDRRSRRS